MDDGGADKFVPDSRDLRRLKAAASNCRGCGLYRKANQTVFGNGKKAATLMLVGEQPGDQEDNAGKPFVGPAGKLLQRALDAADIDRSEAYVTNAVKHFKFVRAERGTRRIHKKPGRGEIDACRPWLVAEIDAVEPDVVVCLGVTAAQSLIARDFRVTAHRGERHHLMPELGVHCDPFVFATVHPSSILRGARDERERAFADLVTDLRAAMVSCQSPR